MFNDISIFQSRKKQCYIASFLRTEADEDGNEINYYDKPKHYELNVQPANGSTDIALYGEKVSKMYKTIVPFSEFNGVFKEGDKAYLEGIKPKEETPDTYGYGANYKIVSVRPQNISIQIYFEKL